MSRRLELLLQRINRWLLPLAVILLGAGVRLTVYLQNRPLFSHPQVDELEYLETPSMPFERPPGTYLPASFPWPRLLFGALSLTPALLMLAVPRRNGGTGAVALLTAVEPTLALSGVQIMPEAPAAALAALSLAAAAGGRHRLAGYAAGLAALFRGEMLLLIPLFLLIRGGRGRVMALFALIPVLPLAAANLASGGPPSVASNGGVNLWIGSDWKLLGTPPGVEFEQYMNLSSGGSFIGRALTSVGSDPAGWAFRGLVKASAFFTLPGPGRNMDPGSALKGVFPLLAVTGLFLAGAAGFRRDVPSAFMAAGLISAFIFFPSVRYRAVFLPAFALAAAALPRKRLLPGAAAVAALSLFLPYPGHVRPGLNTLLSAENRLREGDHRGCIVLLEQARREGYRGADIHNIRASAMAEAGMEFGEVLPEFGLALNEAPESPTVWRNMAAFLWNYGRTGPAREAAARAVRLNPSLRGELLRILTE